MNPPADRPRFSIIIPVYDRADKLTACLQSLAKDTFSGSAEVIVLCDGGPAEMRKAGDAWKGRWPLRWIDQEHAGPAVARNRAMAEAHGELFLFLNDDVILTPGLLTAHHKAHRAQPGHTVMGNTRWWPDVVRSDFMYWAAYHLHVHYLMDDLKNITWEHWHSLNCSIDRCWFEQGHLFDESFPDPAFEDTEYAYRLWKNEGLKISFAPGAVAYHDHFFTPTGYLSKSRMRGASARRFLTLYPELTERILLEYTRMTGRKKRLKLWWRTKRNIPDGPDEWMTRFALAFMAGYDGKETPKLALKCVEEE